MLGLIFASLLVFFVGKRFGSYIVKLKNITKNIGILLLITNILVTFAIKPLFSYSTNN